MFSPRASTFLQPQSSSNLALRDAASVAESHQDEEEEGEGGASEIQQLEEADEEEEEVDENEEEEEEDEDEEEEEARLSSHLNENGRRRRGEESSTTLNGPKGSHMLGGIGGLSTQLSQLGSVATEDFPDEDDMASTPDFEAFEAGELELIETALRNLRSVEGDLRSVEGEIEGSSVSSDLQDMQDIVKLLRKVQAIKARRREAPLEHVTPSLGGSFRQAPSGGEDIEHADIRQVVQAAAATALSAAKTAETVVTSLDRNSQAMEELCKALTVSSSLHSSIQEIARENEEVNEEVNEEENGQKKGEASKLLAIELRQTEIVKSLVKQNRVTHWVLGFIVVSSLVWRYVVVKFAKKVNNTVTNPFQGITDMFQETKEQIERDNPIRFPYMSDGEADVNRRVTEGKGDGTFSLGGLFSGLTGEQEEEQGKSEQTKPNAAEEKKDRGFDFRSIIPGLKVETEAEQQERKAAKEKKKRPPK